MRGSSVAGASLLIFTLAGGCAVAHRERPLSALDARYVYERLARQGERGRTVTTSAYRGVLSRSLFSRCRMYPSDSQLFDRRARACGAALAGVLGIARLYLETAGGPDVLFPVIAEGRVRWLDLPPGSLCGP
jgi:hypothetical protein